MNNPEYFNGWKQIAAYFNIHPDTARRWHQQRPMPICRLGGKQGSVRIERDLLQQWIEQGNKL